MGQGRLRINSGVSSIAEESLRAFHSLGFGSPNSGRERITVSATIAESFADQQLSKLIGDLRIEATDFGRVLLVETNDIFSQSWKSRHRWLKEGFGVSIAGSSQADNLNTLVDMRNALLHGHGNLTDRQAKSVSDVTRLRRAFRKVLNCDLQGRRVILGRDSGQLGIDVAVDYVLCLDAAIQAR